MRLLARKNDLRSQYSRFAGAAPAHDTALGIMLNQIYDKDKVHVHIMHGDITTRKGVRSDNIVAKVGDEVRKYAKSNHYTSKHFKQIIHIVDMDGAYIPNEMSFWT